MQAHHAGLGGGVGVVVDGVAGDLQLEVARRVQVARGKDIEGLAVVHLQCDPTVLILAGLVVVPLDPPEALVVELQERIDVPRQRLHVEVERSPGLGGELVHNRVARVGYGAALRDPPGGCHVNDGCRGKQLLECR